MFCLNVPQKYSFIGSNASLFITKKTFHCLFLWMPCEYKTNNFGLSNLQRMIVAWNDGDLQNEIDENFTKNVVTPAV